MRALAPRAAATFLVEGQPGRLSTRWAGPRELEGIPGELVGDRGASFSVISENGSKLGLPPGSPSPRPPRMVSAALGARPITRPNKVATFVPPKPNELQSAWRITACLASLGT